LHRGFENEALERTPAGSATTPRVTHGDLTVVVVNYGTPDYTIQSVRALLSDGVPADRVVVVDNGSEDDSYFRLEAELADCVLLRIEKNVGYARAANEGTQQLRGVSYLFVNNDAFLHRPGSVSALVAALEDDRVGIVFARVLNPDLTLQPKVAALQTPGVALLRASGLSRLIPNRWQPRWSTHWDHSESREIQASSGVAMLIRGSLWEQLGGFDEEGFMYGEDLDACMRARKAGWKVWFCAEAEFVHIGQGSVGRHWGGPTRSEVIGRSEAMMLWKHLSPLRARSALAFIRLGLAIRWLSYSLLRKQAAAASLRGSLRGYGARPEPAEGSRDPLK
jgi:N-acetylglucosaminyl-diphospho-decaprenol L-rhamnosyltransferase